jgi:hypothetical protein
MTGDGLWATSSSTPHTTMRRVDPRGRPLMKYSE